MISCQLDRKREPLKVRMDFTLTARVRNQMDRKREPLMVWKFSPLLHGFVVRRIASVNL
jgi:hypothetical protein